MDSKFQPRVLFIGGGFFRLPGWQARLAGPV
jgi:hypothetical protein